MRARATALSRNAIPVAKRQIVAGLAELRKFGADAHLYMPGPGIPILGPELVVNGDFNSSEGWALGGWVVSGGNAVAAALPAWAPINRPIAAVKGRSYEVTMVVSSCVSGGVYAQIGTYPDAKNGAIRTVPGTYTDILTTPADSSLIEIYTHAAGFSGSVESISVKEILGYNNKISGITAGNYLDSIGTTHASVDGLVGLVLDGAGSVGAELSNPTTSTTGWTANGATISIDTGRLKCVTTGTGDYGAWEDLPTTIGNTYLITAYITNASASSAAGIRGTDTSFSAIAASGTVAAGASGYLSFYAKAAASTLRVVFDRQALNAVIGDTIYVSQVSIKQITGIHATQATTGNKPTLRRGLVNLLTWSNDLTNAAWTKTGTTSTPNVSTVNLPALNDLIGNTGPSGYANKTYTLAAVLSGSGTVYIQMSNNVDYAPSQLITLTSTPTLYSFTGTFNGTTVATNCSVNLNRQTPATASMVTVDGIGLFQGAYTADQILAQGGIPLTTTAPASSNVGAYAWQFDGDDYLTLGGVPVQMSDDHAVISCAARGADGYLSIFGQGSSSIGNRIQLGIEAGGAIRLSLRDDSVAPNDVSGGVTQIGVPFVASYARRGTTYTLRGNGAQVNAFNRAFGATTFTEANIGRIGPLGSDPFLGKIFAVAVIKGTVTDTQLLIFERMLNALSKYAAGRF